MSVLDHKVARRDVMIWLTLAALTLCDMKVAVAEDAPFAERFVTFDPAVPMWPIQLVDRRGRSTVLAPRRGRTSLVVLWATWCPACHRDIPRLAAAQEALTRDGIDVALVNVDAASVADVLVRAADISTGALPLFFDPDGSRVAAPSPEGRRSPLQLFGMPILFVVDRVGLVRGYVKGSVDWTNPVDMALFRAF